MTWILVRRYKGSESVALHMPTGMQTTATAEPSSSPPASPTSASAMSGFSPCTSTTRTQPLGAQDFCPLSLVPYSSPEFEFGARVLAQQRALVWPHVQCPVLLSALQSEGEGEGGPTLQLQMHMATGCTDWSLQF